MTTSPEFSLILVLWPNMEQPTQEEENEHKKRNAVEGAVPAHTHQNRFQPQNSKQRPHYFFLSFVLPSTAFNNIPHKVHIYLEFHSV